MADKTIPDITTTTVLPAATDYLETGSSTRSAKTLVQNFAQQVATRAALAALDITSAANGVTVVVQGAAARGDGGGATYYYDPASSATPNGVTVIAPGSGTGRWLILPVSALPTGGATHAVLKKNSATNFDASFYPADTINVRDYGATGDGVTDDTAAINAAIAALTSNCALYFPQGKYQTSGLATISGLTNVRIYGTGAVLFQTTQANNLMVVDETCSRFKIDHLIFDGTATSRLNGVHLRMSASYSIVESCEFKGSSDFGCFIGAQSSSTPTTEVRVIGCLARSTKGDGFHCDNVDGVTFVGCIARDTGDDAFAAVGYESYAAPAKNVAFFGCKVYNSGFRGLALLMVQGATVSDFVVNTSVASGIEVSDFGNTVGVFNTDITIRNCDLINCNTSPGPFAAFNLYFCQRLILENVTVRDPATDSCIALSDFDDVQIRDVEVIVTRAGFCRGIVFNDATTVNGRVTRTTWGNLAIDGFGFNIEQADNNEAIYMPTPAGRTVANLLLTGAVGSQVSAGDYIVYGGIAGIAKIGNNTCLQARTITQVGGVAATLFNNN